MFKLEDIKPGHLLELNDGKKKIYATVTYGRSGSLCYSSPEEWGLIENFDVDEFYHIANPKFKIIKVYGWAHNSAAYDRSPEDRPVLWERKEPKEMTMEELESILGYPVKIIK